jgi:acyl-CoA hydrolase
MRLKWKLISVHFGKVLILMQDSCSVCAERTIGSEIILDVVDGTPR